MRVTVDDDICGGHGTCLGLAPEVFDLSDDGFAVVLMADLPEDMREAVRNAVHQCPTGAITMSD